MAPTPAPIPTSRPCRHAPCRQALPTLTRRSRALLGWGVDGQTGKTCMMVRSQQVGPAYQDVRLMPLRGQQNSEAVTRGFLKRNVARPTMLFSRLFSGLFASRLQTSQRTLVPYARILGSPRRDMRTPRRPRLPWVVEVRLRAFYHTNGVTFSVPNGVTSTRTASRSAYRARARKKYFPPKRQVIWSI